ncbi:g4203 [Coccomyxa viridis]|uniref:RNA helicase n=1 Tax=Coccomyxa viridis TaxID=1274662 RepID=A0ABP1FPQ0_9CHLO
MSLCHPSPGGLIDVSRDRYDPPAYARFLWPGFSLPLAPMVKAPAPANSFRNPTGERQRTWFGLDLQNHKAMDNNYEGPPGLEPQNQETARAKTHGHSANDVASHASAAVDGTENSSIYTSATSFEDLDISPKLSAELLQGLYTEMRFRRPSRIQAQTLPLILQPPYKSLIAQAHNGSGKTTCFALAMLSRVDATVNQLQALCLCPTRELVVQNVMVLEKMGKFTSIRTTSTSLHARLQATSHYRADSLRLMGDLRRDAQQPVQFLLFSATFDERIKEFALRVTTDNGREKVIQVFVPKEDLSLDFIKQYQVECPTPLDKVLVLEEMIFPQCEKLGQTIIFVRTREIARTLHTALEKAGHRCTSIRGDLDHHMRDRVVNEFRTGITKILISTDVLARGFDVTQVTLVINYDVPVVKDLSKPAYDTYLHRVGRSGRFGRKGAAFNLVSGAKEMEILSSISEFYGIEIPKVLYNDEDEFVNVLKEAGLTDG